MRHHNVESMGDREPHRKLRKEDLGEWKFKGNGSRVHQIRLANPGTYYDLCFHTTGGTNHNIHRVLCAPCDSCVKYVNPVQIMCDDVNMAIGES